MKPIEVVGLYTKQNDDGQLIAGLLQSNKSVLTFLSIHNLELHAAAVATGQFPA